MLNRLHMKMNRREKGKVWVSSIKRSTKTISLTTYLTAIWRWAHQSLGPDPHKISPSPPVSLNLLSSVNIKWSSQQSMMQNGESQTPSSFRLRSIDQQKHLNWMSLRKNSTLGTTSRNHIIKMQVWAKRKNIWWVACCSSIDGSPETPKQTCTFRLTPNFFMIGNLQFRPRLSSVSYWCQPPMPNTWTPLANQ